MDGDGYNAGCHLGWDLDSSTFELDLETDSWAEPSMIRVKKGLFHQARKNREADGGEPWHGMTARWVRCGGGPVT
jgi:hypothetical protein